MTKHLQINLVRNLIVVLALMLGTSVLIFLEVLVLSTPPSGVWFFGMMLLSLRGFFWANKNAFERVQITTKWTIVICLWFLTVFLVVVLGVNLKFALGGHV